MARLLSTATGNWTASGTWYLVDSTSELDSEANNTSTTTSYVASQAFTPGAITIDSISVKARHKTTGGGTFSVELYNSTAGSSVAGTETTINLSDLNLTTTAEANEGTWITMKLATPVLLLAATNYQVRVKSSVNGTVNLYRASAAGNWSRLLAVTTNQAPAAADILYITGNQTGAGTGNDITVTMNETATTDYGAISIGHRGTLEYGTAASTNYYLKTSGTLNVYAGGKLHIGTVATPMPSSSTAVLEFDCTTNVEFGLEVRNNATLVVQGASKATIWTLLTADEAATSTVISVASTSGWVNGDVLGFASTTRTPGETEKKTISTVDSGVQVTLTAGLTNAHSGTSPTQGEVINLTRNVKIRGISTSNQSYIHIEDDPDSVDIDYAEIYQIGSSATDKYGIAVDDTTGAVSIRYCAIYEGVASGSEGLRAVTGSSGGTFSNNVLYNLAGRGIITQATSGTAWTLDGNVVLGLCASGGIDLDDVGANVTNNIVAGTTGAPFVWSEVAALGTVSGNTAHSSTGYGFATLNITSGTISNSISWRNSTGGGNMSNTRRCTIDGFVAFGNATLGLSLDNWNGIVRNVTLNAGVTLTQLSGFYFDQSNNDELIIADSTSGATTTHATGDINIANTGLSLRAHFSNCLFASSTELANQANLAQGNWVGSQKHDQTNGNHKTWKNEGVLSSDTTIFDTSPSLRMVPNSATNKLESNFIRVAVANGASLTPSVKVRESVAGDGTDYNGSRIRLIVRANPAAGITENTVLATATASSEGSFETLSGTTATVTDDSILEFFVDCDGTTGWVNVDTFSISSQADTRTFQFWANGQPGVYGDNAVGGGTTIVVNNTTTQTIAPFEIVGY